MKIQSHLEIGDAFDDVWTQDHIKNEPMLFNCDLTSARKLGGPITREFLSVFPDDAKIVVDSRVHMLMPGWFSCIPGFHHDDVPRSGENGQPNYANPEYRSKHIMGLVNGDICPTEFAVGEIDLEIPTGTIYKEWHPQVKEAIDSGKLESVKVPSGRYIHFDDRSFHQGTRAVASGWRWFIRVSYDTDRVDNVTNELRRQVQVYLEHPMEGW